MKSGIIISTDAEKYFKEHNVNRENVAHYIANKYNLVHNDEVFLEGNVLGYRRKNAKII